MNGEPVTGVGDWLERRARGCARDTAWSFHGVRRSYAEAAERVAKLASGLGSLGVRRGDRVAFLGRNHPALLETLFACARIGAVFVPLNFRLAAAEVAYGLADCDASVVVHSTELAPVLQGAWPPAARGRRLVLDGEAGAREGGARDSYEALVASSPGCEPSVPVGADDVALILYTSGTTGRPKGAMLTHGNLAWNALNVLVDMDLRRGEVALVITPMFHTAALGMVCLPVLLRGGQLVIHEAFEPEAALEAIAGNRVSYLFGVPETYDRMAAAAAFDSSDLSSLRILLCGGAPVSASTIRTYIDRGLAFVQGYGMTETSPGALVLDERRVADKVGSAGVPMFFTDVRLVGPGGEETAAGECGELLVRGPNVFAGYWRRPAETAAAMEGRWFHSGDVAVADGDGCFRIVDRMKDLIISGGENVYPAEVELALAEHPAVREAAVIGVPDPDWGEVGRAVVVAREPGSLAGDSVLAFLRDRIARYKVPKSVVVAEDLPHTATGKIDKVALRARYGAAAAPTSKG